MSKIIRPKIGLEIFERALLEAKLEAIDRTIIDYIRFTGFFTQPIIVKELKLSSKPPALSRIGNACRQIGECIPEHFNLVRDWSQAVSADNVRWDGDLICSSVYDIDGERLSPENGNSQFHVFAVHKELFNGFDEFY